MINRKFSGPLGRATKFSHPRATMSVIVIMFTAFCAIRLLDFTPTDHRRQQNIGGVRVLVASTTKGVDITLGGAGGSRCARQREFCEFGFHVCFLWSVEIWLISEK